MYHGAHALSFIVTGRTSSTIYPHGAALIIDDTYSIVEEVFTPIPGTSINMHEFKVEDDGSTALLLYDSPLQWPETDNPYHQWAFVDSGFAEIDLASKAPRFMWNSSDHIALTTSTKPQPGFKDRSVWDWMYV